VNFLGGAPGIVVGNQIATLDPTAFGQADKVLMNFTGWISSILANRMGDGGLGHAAFAAFAPVASPVVAAANDAFASVLPATAYAADKGVGAVPQAGMVDRHSGTAIWTNAFGGFRNQQADGPNLASRSTGYGGAIGIDGQWRPDLRVGAFIGAGQGSFDVDRNSQSIDSDYVYGGVYGRFEWLTHFLDWAVQAGRSDNKSRRLVANNMAPGGLETASASYDGWYVSPEIAYGVRIPINANMTLTPTARVRYLAGQFDAYNETGSAQTLSVGTRNLQNLEERFELALTLYEPMSAGIVKTTATLGALAQQRIGDRTIDTVLIGQDLAFAPPGQNSGFGGFAGLAFDYRITSSANIYGGVEAAIMDDRSTTATARGGVRVRF
ncbi:MAG: autotransporter outer membrane beta-barrel domain-containing protein, partial [Pseudorhodoplanes sp.]